jgi:hypothetical protein
MPEPVTGNRKTAGKFRSHAKTARHGQDVIPAFFFADKKFSIRTQPAIRPSRVRKLCAHAKLTNRMQNI